MALSHRNYSHRDSCRVNSGVREFTPESTTIALPSKDTDIPDLEYLIRIKIEPFLSLKGYYAFDRAKYNTCRKNKTWGPGPGTTGTSLRSTPGSVFYCSYLESTDRRD